jgi:GNAT superfamily N-acetyltransferase
MDDLFKLAGNFATSFKPNEQSFKENIELLLSDNSVFLRVAEYNNELIGYCLGFDHYTFYANGRVSWVEELMVEATYRNQGIGKILMEHFEEWSKSRGSKLIALATRRAAPFYKGLGYEESAAYFRKLL